MFVIGNPFRPSEYVGAPVLKYQTKEETFNLTDGKHTSKLHHALADSLACLLDLISSKVSLLDLIFSILALLNIDVYLA